MSVYYIDQTTGNDADTGLTEALAWKTVAKVNASSFSGDDQILFKRGETWREQLTVPSAGTSGHPIIFGAYGTGALPRILGSTQTSTWTDEGGGLWYATCAADPVSVWLINTDETIKWGKKETLKASLNAEYDWWWDDPNDRLYVYAASDPDGRYTSIEKPTIAYLVDNNSKEYITIQNLELAYCSDIGVRIMRWGGWTVDGCTIHHIGVKNGSLEEGVLCRGANLTVKNCTIHNCGNHGVNLSTDDVIQTVANALIEHNIFYDNYHSDIDCQNGAGAFTGAVIRYNLFYNTADFDLTYTNGAIYVLADSVAPNDINGIQIYYNIIYEKSAGGIVIRGAVDSPVIYNNTIYGALSGSTESSVGIHVLSLDPGVVDPTSVVIKNNIVMDTYSPCLYVTDKDYVSACDNNCWYQSSGGVATYTNIEETSYHYDDFAAYKAATGWDANGLWEDPKFVDPENEDFHLQSDSPCINAAADVGLTEDFEGNDIW